MSYVKLDAGILTSSLWVERSQRDLFITALIMAVPFYVKNPMPALRVRSLEETGFVVPPGDYGFIHAAGSGIVRMALIDDETGYLALERLGEPDPHSRTPSFDGRRLVRVEGGYIVLNYEAYRSKDYSSAARQRRYRERLKERSVTRDEDNVTRNITQAEVEVKEKKNTHNGAMSSSDLVAEGISEQAAIAWLEVRRNKRAKPPSRLAWTSFKTEATKAGWKLEDAVRKCVARNWITFDAEFVKHNAPPASQGPRTDEI